MSIADKSNIPPKYNKDGTKKKLNQPTGLVIPPCYIGIVSSIRIRRKYETEKHGKYHFVGVTDIEPLRIFYDDYILTTDVPNLYFYRQS